MYTVMLNKSAEPDLVGAVTCHSVVAGRSTIRVDVRTDGTLAVQFSLDSRTHSEEMVTSEQSRFVEALTKLEPACIFMKGDYYLSIHPVARMQQIHVVLWTTPSRSNAYKPLAMRAIIDDELAVQIANHVAFCRTKLVPTPDVPRVPMTKEEAAAVLDRLRKKYLEERTDDGASAPDGHFDHVHPKRT